MLSFNVFESPEADREGIRQLVSIQMLGSFALFKNGTHLPVRPGGKTEALLTLLALHCYRRIPRATLLGEVWPEAEPELSIQALNSLLHSLRRLLGDALGGEPPVTCLQGAYQLNLAAGVGVDYARFDELAGEGDLLARTDTALATVSYEKAIALYGGDLCAGEHHAAMVERERLRARYLTLLVRSAFHYYQSHDIGRAMALALRLLEHDPCREDAHRVVMRCHVIQGERVQALRQYRVCQQMLRDEFDAAPESATIALYDQIRLQPGSV
jgi:DNA-binding SARP family transcriptional activator